MVIASGRERELPVKEWQWHSFKAGRGGDKKHHWQQQQQQQQQQQSAPQQQRKSWRFKRGGHVDGCFT